MTSIKIRYQFFFRWELSRSRRSTNFSSKWSKKLTIKRCMMIMMTRTKRSLLIQSLVFGDKKSCTLKISKIDSILFWLLSLKINQSDLVDIWILSKFASMTSNACIRKRRKSLNDSMIVDFVVQKFRSFVMFLNLKYFASWNVFFVILIFVQMIWTFIIFFDR